MEKETLEVTK